MFGKCNEKRSYNYGISNVFLYISYLFEFLLLTKSVDMQNSHLFNDCRLAGFTGSEQQQTVGGPINLLVFLQLPVDLVTDAFLSTDVIRCLRCVPVPETAHRRQGGPPTAGPLLGGPRAAFRAGRHRGCRLCRTHCGRITSTHSIVVAWLTQIL